MVTKTLAERLRNKGSAGTDVSTKDWIKEGDFTAVLGRNLVPKINKSKDRTRVKSAPDLAVIIEEIPP